MAITTMAGVIGGLRYPTLLAKGSSSGNSISANVFRTSWYAAGFPAAATANTSGMAGQSLTSSDAAPSFTNPASGNTYLAKATPVIGGNGWRNGCLFDRLWENSGIDVTVTTAQTINSAAWPARDLNGSTNGEGVLIALEVSTTIGAAISSSASISYTNSAGTAGRTGAILPISLGASAVGCWHFFALDSGDLGVRSVESITLSASLVSGTVHLVALRPIAILGAYGIGNIDQREDAITLGMPRLYDNTVLTEAVLMNASSQGVQSYELTYTQG